MGGILLLVLAGLGAWFEPTQFVRGKVCGEAFFGNRPTTYWRQKLESENPIDQDEGPRRLKEGKAAAVPVLIDLTRCDSANVRVQAISILARLKQDAFPATDALLTLLADPDIYVRQTAARALGEIHPDDPRVVPALLEKLAGDEKATAIRPLSEYGANAKAAVPRLIELLENDPDPNLQWEAARTLGKIGPDAQAAIPSLIKALKSTSGTLREHAAETLGELQATVAVPDLIAVLDDSDPRVRRDTIRALGQLGPAAKPAWEKIERLRNDEDVFVRQAVVIALRRIDPARTPKKEE
jgi:HEAT repeat protein